MSDQTTDDTYTLEDIAEAIGTEDEMMSTKRVATMFGVTTETIRDWIDRGDITGYRVKHGKAVKWYIKKADAVAYAKARFG